MRGSFSTRATLPVICLATLILSPQSHAQCVQHPGNSGTICCKPVGPDVIVGDIQEVINYTVTSSDLVDAFSMGTISCNVGNANVIWVASTNQHPVVGQNLFKYKLAGGYAKFEHIGQGFLKHTFLALQQNTCGCGGCTQGGAVLGVGCSDPYTAARNGSQGLATATSSGGCGPKWQVNAANGVYTFPPTAPAGSGSVYRRLQGKKSELEVSNGSTIRYFGECQYVTQDDAASGNKNNNASYREMSISGGPVNYAIALGAGSTTQREKPGIRAWKVIDPTVTETDINVAGDGQFIVSSKATSLGGSQWHYEYAVQNLNSDRSGQSFTVPIPAGAVVTNVGFHDVDYHDGDGIGGVNFSSLDWAPTVGASSVSWACELFNANANANALRWGTMYNFRFDCNKPPVAGSLTLGLYKNGAPGSVAGGGVVPSLDCNNNNVADATDIANATSLDLNLNGIPDECETPPDPCHQADFDNNNVIDIDDLVSVITAWGACGGACPPYCVGDANHNCQVNIDDLVMVITEWGPCN